MKGIKNLNGAMRVVRGYKQPFRVISEIHKMKSNKGFTFLEIMFAVTILAAAVLPIYGLQSAALERISRNESELQATLIARQILAFIEGAEENLRSSSARLSALEAIRRVANGARKIDYQPPNPEVLEQFSVSFVIEPWQIQSALTANLLRLRLEISWSPDPRDSLEFTYLIPPIKR